MKTDRKKKNASLGKNVASAFRLTLPVMAGYVFLGFAFGLLMRTKGFALWIPIVMSAAIYSGALEFAAVPVLSAAFDPLGSFFLGFLLSIRHLFYGIPMLKRYAKTGKSKPFLIFGLTDETFSILSTTAVPDGVQPTAFYFFVTLLDFLYWVSGTALGAAFGEIVTFNVDGLDFALTALFVVLFIEQISRKEGLKSGFIGLLASTAVRTLFGSEYFVLVSMAVILVILLAGKKVIVRE